MFPPDYEEFKSLLVTASRTAFAEMKQSHPDEDFYAFGLVHLPLWEYIIGACNSEQGLTRTAEHYKLDKYHMGHSQISIEEHRKNLRWNSGDWAYLDCGNAHFAPVNDWLGQYDPYYWPDHLEDPAFDRLYDMLIMLSRDALIYLDREGMFGVGTERDKIVLNLMMGDQDESWLEHARLLNPPHVYQRWLSEIRNE